MGLSKHAEVHRARNVEAGLYWPSTNALLPDEVQVEEAQKLYGLVSTLRERDRPII